MTRKFFTCIHCDEKIYIFKPAEICAFMEREGWVMLTELHGWRTYGKTETSPGVEVPMKFGASDWTLRYKELIRNLRIAFRCGVPELMDRMRTHQERVEHAEREMLRWGAIMKELERQPSP